MTKQASALDDVWSDIVSNRSGVNSDSVDEPAPDEKTDRNSSISKFGMSQEFCIESNHKIQIPEKS